MVQSHEAETLCLLRFTLYVRLNRTTLFTFKAVIDLRSEVLKVIPVIDVLNGVAVHAVRGERLTYQPLKSLLSVSPDPLDVARAFSRLGFGELYVADLNAITGNGDNFGIVECIVKETGMRLMVDAGVADFEKAKALLQHGASTIIVGTETLTDIAFVKKAVQVFGPERSVVSLDTKQGQLLAKFSLDRFPDAVAVLRELQRTGVKRIIVLDLARVGSGEGVDAGFLRTVLENTSFDLWVGGGVRNIDDLLMLRDMGVAGVLLATALHSGKITVEQIVAAEMTLA
jgi:phosphoribosylformimino-5-aminoimidazole carboxamide ribotide isomerase